MAKEWAKAFYKSTAWLKCRESYITKVYGLCERCSKPGLILHHKTELTPNNINNPDITLNHDKLEYLCLDCHNKEHFKIHEAVREGLRFNSDGELVEDKP